MTNSKNFMMIFRFEPNPAYQPTQEDINNQQQQWGAFIGNLAVTEKLVSTNQLGFEGKQLSADLTVREGINVAEGQTLGGNMIVKAETIDEAIELAKACPILQMGGTVEVRDIMPMN